MTTLRQSITLFTISFALALYACLVAPSLSLAWGWPSGSGGSVTNAGTAVNMSGALPDGGCPSCTTSGFVGVNTGIGTPAPGAATLGGGYSQGSYSSYRQGSYGGGYSQGSYNTYGQGSYGGGYSQGAYTPNVYSSNNLGEGAYWPPINNYNQGAYFSCPAGYTMMGTVGENTGAGPSCCPNANYAIVDTNGSGKGGEVEQCSAPTTNNTPSTPSACTINGTSVSHGSSYTFYTQGNVPYGSTCPTVSLQCNNGEFSGITANHYTSCTVNDPVIGNISITATPSVIRFGEGTTIEWNGANSAACTVTGANLNASGITGSQAVTGITGESVYTLNCTLGPTSKSASTTVKVLQKTQET